MSKKYNKWVKHMKNNISVSIKAVGDISPGDFAVHGFGVGALSKKYGCRYHFERVVDILDGADILIGNLEGVLSARCREEHLAFGGLIEMADALRDAGFGVLTLANNHAFEHGVDVLNETIWCCNNAGIQICGLRGQGPYYCEPVFIKVKGITVGILAYNWVGLWDQDNIDEYLATISDGLVNYTWNRNREEDIVKRQLARESNVHVFHDIERLKNEVDAVVLLPHWGYEWTRYPPYGVILEARSFIDAGVDLIVGAHPHVAQGIEVYKERVIAYSLGNFLFDPQPEANFNGMVFECAVTKDKIGPYNFMAITCDEKCQPKRANNKEQEIFKQSIVQSTSLIVSDSAVTQLDDEKIYKEYEKGYNRRKIMKVKYLLFAMLKNPSMVKPILQKVGTLIEIILLRLQGKRIRW